MIRPVQDEASIVPERLTYSREGVGPFAATAGARLKQLLWVIVAREPHLDAVHFAGPALDAGGVVLSVLISRLSGTLVLHALLRAAFRALWRIEPGEEVVLKPGKQRLQLLDLLAGGPKLRLHLKIPDLDDVLGHD